MDQPKKEWWGAKYLNPQDRERDIKLLVFVGATGMAAYWLTKEQARSAAITREWVDALKYFLASSSLGGAAWYAVDKWKGKTTDTPTDTTNEETK